MEKPDDACTEIAVGGSRGASGSRSSDAVDRFQAFPEGQPSRDREGAGAATARSRA